MPDFMKNSFRVVGGEPAPSMIPWQVAILYGGMQFCGGTILDSCTVLSAKHCEIGLCMCKHITLLKKVKTKRTKNQPAHLLPLPCQLL